MISPALFIGLGSTGLKIIEKLQSLVLEEYGVSSLPIFRYVAFETDQSVRRGPDSEVILIHPTISSTDAVRAAIKAHERDYYDWLDKSVLNIPGGVFVSGAGNIRMAGRLCLWENWQTLASDRTKSGCADILQQAQRAIISAENRTKTSQMLERIYSDWGRNIPDMGIQIDDKPNVYIVGTLCGGTCSGMFIDIAYYVKQLFGLWRKDIGGDRAKVIGAFTIYDADDLKSATTDTAKSRAANCWAALLEYDYYCHKFSQYRVKFPDGTLIDSNERPVDYLYLMSCSGNGTNLHTANGGADEESLANMMAMVLFSETVEGLLGEKEKIRIDRLGRPRALTPNKNQHMASIATCGLATFRYPKYRVVEGASCQFAGDLFKKLIGIKVKPNDLSVVTKQANNAWNGIKMDSRDVLLRTSNGLLTNEKCAWIDNEKEELMMKSADELVKTIQKELFDKLREGRADDAHICARLPEVEAELLKRVNDEVIKVLNANMNVAYVKEFIVQLDQVIESTIQDKKIKKYPDYNPKKDARDLEPDFWAISVCKAKEISKEKKIDYLEEVKNEITLAIEKIRDYRIRSVYEKIREEIGVARQPSEDWIRAGNRSIKQELDNVERNITICIDDLNHKAEEMKTDPMKTQDVVIITRGKDLAEDIQDLYASLKTKADADEILRRARFREIGGQGSFELEFHKWLGYNEASKDKTELEIPILRGVRERALQLRETVVIAEAVLRRIRALGVNLCQFVKNSLPHLQLSGDLGAVGTPPEFIAGKDRDNNASFIKNFHKELRQQCPSPVEFDEKCIVHMDELEHLLLFYKEQALIYMDENLSTSGLFAEKYSTYEDFLRSHKDAPSRTVHTHKLGGTFFDVWIEKRRDEAKEFMMIAQELFSTKDEQGNWKDSEIFKVEEELLVLRFRGRDGVDVVITGDDTGVSRLASNKEFLASFVEMVKNHLQNVGKEGFINRGNKLAAWNEAEVRRQGKPESEAIKKGIETSDKYLGSPDGLLYRYFPKEE